MGRAASGGARVGRRDLLLGGLAGMLVGQPRLTAATTIPLSAERQFAVTNDNELAATIAQARPGDHLVLADGAYRLGAVAVSGMPGAPIILRAANRQMVTVIDNPEITGDHLLLHGFAFGAHGLGAVGGSDVWVVRCSFTGGSSIAIRALQPGLRVWHSRFDGPGAASRAIAFDTAGGVDGTRGHVYRSLFTNWAAGGDNGTEVITVGFSANRTHVESETVIEECLFQDCNLGGPEDETIAIKSSRVTVRNCTFERTRWCQVRHGQNNLIEGCIHADSPSGGFRIRDYNARLINCKTIGASGTQVFAGDSLSGEEDQNWSATGAYPRGDRCKIYNHEAVDTAPRIGSTFSSVFNPLRPATLTEILGNRGRAPTLEGGGRQTNTNPSGQWTNAAPVPYVPAIKLTPANVGPNA